MLITPRYGNARMQAGSLYLPSDQRQRHGLERRRLGGSGDRPPDDTQPGAKEPWLLRKTRYIASLEAKPAESLLVTAAEKAHNAADMVLDSRRDPSMWSKFNAELEGAAWYLLRMHQQLNHRLPQS